MRARGRAPPRMHGKHGRRALSTEVYGSKVPCRFQNPQVVQEIRGRDNPRPKSRVRSWDHRWSGSGGWCGARGLPAAAAPVSPAARRGCRAAARGRRPPAARAGAGRGRWRRPSSGRRARAAAAAHFAAQALGAAEVQDRAVAQRRGPAALAHVDAAHPRAQVAAGAAASERDRAAARGRRACRPAAGPRRRRPAGRRSALPRSSVPSAATGDALARPRRPRRPGRARGRRSAGRAGSRRGGRPPRTAGYGSTAVRSSPARRGASSCRGRRLERRAHPRGLGAAHAGHGDLATATRRESRSHSQPPPSSAEDAGERGGRAGGRAARRRQWRAAHPAASFDPRGADPAGRRRAAWRADDAAPRRPRRPPVEAADEDALVAAVARGRPRGRAAARPRRRHQRRRRRRGLPGHRRARRHARRRARRRAALEVAGGRAVGPARRRCVADGLAGIECLAGIPGSVGATPIQNVGAYGQEVAETIRSVRVLDRERGAVATLGARATAASPTARARSSASPGRWVVLAVTFELEPSRRARRRSATPSSPARSASSSATARRWPTSARPCSALRRGKGMVIDPADPDTVSAGSFFTNPVLDAGRVRRARAPRRRAPRRRRAPPAFPRGRRAREDVGRVAHRARGLPPRPRRPATASRSPPSTRSR